MVLSSGGKVLAVLIVLVVAGAGLYVGLPAVLAPAKNTKTNTTNPSNSTSNSSCVSCANDPIATDGGNRMTMTIPMVGIVVSETDVKDHFTMPSNTAMVVVNISWDKTGWNLDLAIGMGDCPDNGQTMAEAKNVQRGPVVLEFPKSCGDALSPGQWFIHAHANDATGHRGETVTFAYTVMVMFK